MSDSTAALRQQIGSASDLQSVVRTMRALAASSITQYQKSVLALAEYRRAVNQGLSACLREVAAAPPPAQASAAAAPGSVGAIVFGSDEGLVGQFNELIADHVVRALSGMPGPHDVWVVGERLRARLVDAGVPVIDGYSVPTSVEAVSPLVDRLQFDTGTHVRQVASPHIQLFYNRPKVGASYEPVQESVLPLDASWSEELVGQRWPTATLPEVMGDGPTTLRALIREHLFISLFRACAESLASENASRLAAMERADKNIDDSLTSLRGRLRSQRQRSIDEELFDLTSGYEALSSDH